MADVACNVCNYQVGILVREFTRCTQSAPPGATTNGQCPGVMIRIAPGVATIDLVIPAKDTPRAEPVSPPLPEGTRGIDWGPGKPLPPVDVKPEKKDDKGHRK